MMLRNFVAIAMGASVALAVTTNADAATVTAEIIGHKVNNIRVQYAGTEYHAGGGAFLWTLHSDDAAQLPIGVGEQFIAFCIEATESVPAGEHLEYDVVNPSDAPNIGWPQMGAEKADMLARWFGAYYRGDKLEDWLAGEALAFQMGIWEIIAETDDVLSLVSGNLAINNQLGARALAQGWLDDEAWQQDDARRLSLIALTSPMTDAMKNIQDQILVAPSVVPLPAPLLAGGLLLAGLGMRRWRATRQSI